MNERHYGAEQVHLWRQGFAIRPPVRAFLDQCLPQNDVLYARVPTHRLPSTESLEDMG